MKNTKIHKHHQSKLDRIERKCDRILSEILMMRYNSRNATCDADNAIDKLHRMAHKLRNQCEYERGYIRQMFNAKPYRK